MEAGKKVKERGWATEREKRKQSSLLYKCNRDQGEKTRALDFRGQEHFKKTDFW